jgi:adenosylhomocysteine nucleosidase
MKLTGRISPDRPLIVVALREEAAYLDDRLPVLLTGIGKINAATALTRALMSGPKPSVVINLGTAGALRPGLAGAHEIGEVIQHDLDADLLCRMTGRQHAQPIRLAGPGAVLATGDVFVSDEQARERLADRADLVDMEGYAIAWAASVAGVPARLIKHVSDTAGDSASVTWPESVDRCAQDLAEWVSLNLV